MSLDFHSSPLGVTEEWSFFDSLSHSDVNIRMRRQDRWPVRTQLCTAAFAVVHTSPGSLRNKTSGNGKATRSWCCHLCYDRGAREVILEDVTSVLLSRIHSIPFPFR